MSFGQTYAEDPTAAKEREQLEEIEKKKKRKLQLQQITALRRESSASTAMPELKETLG